MHAVVPWSDTLQSALRNTASVDSNITSLEVLCRLACGKLQGTKIDLQGRVLASDGTFRLLASPVRPAEQDARPVHGSKYVPAVDTVNLVLCGPLTCIANGTLMLPPNFCLVIDSQDVKLESLNICGDRLTTADIANTSITARGPACKLAVSQSHFKNCSFRAQSAASVQLTRCTVKGAPVHGVIAEGLDTDVGMTHCTITRSAGCNIAVRDNASVTLDRVAIGGSKTEHGLSLEGAGRVEAKHCSFTHNAVCGVSLHNGVTKLASCSFQACKSHGLSIFGEGAIVEVQDCRFLDSGSCSVSIEGAGRVRLRRCTCHYAALHGLNVARGEGQPPRARGGAIEAIECKFADSGSCGVAVDGAHVRLRGCITTGSHIHGLNAIGAGADVAARDCVFAESESCGVAVGGGAEAFLLACTCRGSKLHGMMVTGAGSTARASDCTFEANDLCAVGVYSGGTAGLERCACSASRKHGLNVQGGGTVDARECSFGQSAKCGVAIGGGGSGKLRKCSVIGSGRHGMIVEGSGSNLDAQGCRVAANAQCGVIVGVGASAKLHNSVCEGSVTRVEEEDEDDDCGGD